MAPLNFPSLPAPTYPLTISTEDPALKSDFENGSQQTRPKFTRQRQAWGLSWNALTTADRETLAAFFITTAGGSLSFLWTEPVTSTPIEVRFISFTETQLSPDLYTVSITIREV